MLCPSTRKPLRLVLHGQITSLNLQRVSRSRIISLTTELVFLGGIGTDTGCAGCRWVEITHKSIYEIVPLPVRLEARQAAMSQEVVFYRSGIRTHSTFGSA